MKKHGLLVLLVSLGLLMGLSPVTGAVAQGPTTQLVMTPDRSGSIGMADRDKIREGLARAIEDPSCLPKVPSGTNEGTVTTGNAVYHISVRDVAGGGGIGTYTVGTAAGHPVPGQNVLYGGAAANPWSTYLTVKSYTTSTEYVATNSGPTPSAGCTVVNLELSNTSVALIGAGVRTTWSVAVPDALDIVQDTNVEGTTLADSRVRVTTEVANRGDAPVRIGIRYEWDIMIDGRDGSWFAERNPDASWISAENQWSGLTFEHYETTDNPAAPVFTIFGTVNGPVTFTPRPTPPDLLQFVAWGGVYGFAFDFTPTGRTIAGAGLDSAVAYYWGNSEGNARELLPGESISVTQYLYVIPPGPTPTPTATPTSMPTSTPTSTSTPTNTPTPTPTPMPVEECYCCSAGDSIYRIDGSSFYGYTTKSASDSPLIRVTSPPAPGGWYQPDFAPDGSWQLASEVWWDSWDAPSWAPLPGDGDCRPIGLQDEDDNQEAQSETTHLYRRKFTLSPPHLGMRVTQAVLEMWSDNKTEWWWGGYSVSYGREGYIGQVNLFPGHVGPHGGTYILAIQNSNDRASHHNPQGTACRLCVTWVVPSALGYQVYLPLILKAHPFLILSLSP